MKQISKAGRELDALIAEKVMGITKDNYTRSGCMCSMREINPLHYNSTFFLFL